MSAPVKGGVWSFSSLWFFPALNKLCDHQAPQHFLSLSCSLITLSTKLFDLCSISNPLLGPELSSPRSPLLPQLIHWDEPHSLTPDWESLYLAKYKANQEEPALALSASCLTTGISKESVTEGSRRLNRVELGKEKMLIEGG